MYVYAHVERCVWLCMCLWVCMIMCMAYADMIVHVVMWVAMGFRDEAQWRARCRKAQACGRGVLPSFAHTLITTPHHPLLSIAPDLPFSSFTSASPF